jgi:type VI protein secretion system component Hcp
LQGDAAAHRCDYPSTRQRPVHRTESERTAKPAPIRAAQPNPVLALQRQIGNRAVGELIARDPKAPAKPAPKKEPELKDGIWAIVPGVGTIELHSAQIGTNRHMSNPTGQGVNREAGAPQVTEMVITSDMGDHSDKLFRESLWGKGMEVEIRFVKGGKAYMTVKLHGALITSYSVSGHGGVAHDQPLESWALNAVKIEYETDQKATSGWSD